MRWWLRAHRTGTVVAVAVGLGALTWLAASGTAIEGTIASPIAAGSAVPIALWLPLAFVATLCWSCSIDDERSGRTIAIRSDRRLLAGFVAAAVGLALLALVPALATQADPSAAIARNAAGLTGLALLARLRLGSTGASAITAAYLALAALLGARPHGAAAWWAWPVAEPVDAWGVGVAAALLLVGLLATASDPRAVPWPRRAAATRWRT